MRDSVYDAKDDGDGGAGREHGPAIADGRLVHCGYCGHPMQVAHSLGGGYQVQCAHCGVRAPIGGTYYAAVSSSIRMGFAAILEASR